MRDVQAGTQLLFCHLLLLQRAGLKAAFPDFFATGVWPVRCILGDLEAESEGEATPHLSFCGMLGGRHAGQHSRGWSLSLWVLRGRVTVVYFLASVVLEQ